MKTLTILGSTGSVGRQVLDVVRKHPNDFKVVGLSAYSNEDLLREQLEEFSPSHYYFPTGAVEIQTSLFDLLQDDLYETKCLSSLEDLAAIESDIVVLAVSGISGLWAAVKTLERGATLAIANKETLVCAGRHLRALEKKYGGKILPLDTEHSAIMECLKGENKKQVSKVILTASGGALRDYPIDKLSKISAEEALNHPTWQMGKKITIDCSTLFNKGLEVIEAMVLFDIPFENISILMHRESIIHSLVEFQDGSQKALLANPKLALTIETALYYPDLGKNSVESLDLARVGQLTFSDVDYNRYPCLKIVLDAAKDEGQRIALTAADEILVDYYLDGRIKYTDIAVYLSKVAAKFAGKGDVKLDDVMNVDSEARVFTAGLLGKK